MTTHRRLTYEDRCQIAALLKRGISKAAIARDLGVHRSTVGREIRRHGGQTGYYYHWAQSRAEERQAARDSQVRKMKGALLAFVEERLRVDWSPQQISGWLHHRQKELPTVRHERIYQHVW